MNVYRRLVDGVLIQTLVNASMSGGRLAGAFVEGRKLTVPLDEQIQRVGICEVCEFFTGTTCKKCGCHIRFKAKLQTEHCPIGKW